MNSLTAIGLKHLKDILLDYKKEELSMESNEEISSRLKFIGHIQKDEKINVRYVNRQPNNWLTTFSRSFLYPDSRGNALKFARDVIFRSFEILEQYIRKQNLIEAKEMVCDLVKSQQGLINLKHTYIDDTKFCCDMDVLIGKIASRLSIIREEHNSFFESENKVEL